VVFEGSVTLAVVLVELDDPRHEVAGSVLVVGLGAIVLAVAEAAVAPTLASLVETSTFERVAAVLALVVTARTASATVADYLPVPATVLALGPVAGLDPTGARPVLVDGAEPVLAAAGAGLVGTALALMTALAGPRLRGPVDPNRFRFGSAVAPAVLSLSLVGVTDGPSSLSFSARRRYSRWTPALGAGRASPRGVDASRDTGTGERRTPTRGRNPSTAGPHRSEAGAGRSLSTGKPRPRPRPRPRGVGTSTGPAWPGPDPDRNGDAGSSREPGGDGWPAGLARRSN